MDHDSHEAPSRFSGRSLAQMVMNGSIGEKRFKAWRLPGWVFVGK